MKYISCIWKSLTKHYVFSLPASLFICLLSITILAPNLSSWFFGSDPSPEKVITYIGICCGGVTVLLQLNVSAKRNENMVRQLEESNKRNKNMEEANKIAERGQINTRFKDAAGLLASQNTSSILSGIYALHQIAVECNNTSQHGYVKVIHDILCAFIRDGIQRREREKDPEDISDREYEYFSKYPKTIQQTLVDVLFKSLIYDDYKSDLSCTNFSEINFNGASIKNVNFEEADLTECLFCDTTMDCVVFKYSVLYQANFSRSKISNVNFQGASLLKTIFDYTNIKDSNITKYVQEVSMVGVNFNGGDLSNLEIEKSDFSGANLSKCNLSETKISRSKFSNVNLSEANFYSIDLDDVNFNNANLSGIELTNNNIKKSVRFDEGVNFSGAKLNGSQFGRRTLRKANFSGANLDRVNFCETVLIDSIFCQANLTFTDFSQATLCNSKFNDTEINQANFRGSDLSRTDFSNVKFIEVDFGQSHLYPESKYPILEGAIFTGSNLESYTYDEIIEKSKELTKMDQS